PLRTPRRNDRCRHHRQIRRRILPHRQLSTAPSSTVTPNPAAVIDIPISETTSRCRLPATSHFRFPNTLQNLGSGTGKPIKFRDQKPIRKRDPAQSSTAPRTLTNRRSASACCFSL